MSEQQRLLLNETTDMSEIELREVVLFARYIKYRKSNAEMPERLIIKDEEELAQKIQKGLDDVVNDRVHTFEEVYNSSKAILN